MESRIDYLFELLIPAVVLIHLVAAPYTKVEESFNIQATHDVLVYGTPLSNIYQKLSSSYDHFAFPGAVPRTFIGPVLLAGIARPFEIILGGLAHPQVLVRAVLGLFNALALIFFKRQLHIACSPAVARWYLVMQASQFHIMFYASRTLPNMFAFGLTTIAFGLLLPPTNRFRANARIRVSVALFVFAAVVFRSEIAILLGTNALWLLVDHQTSLQRLISPFLISFVAALVISVPIDSYFWQKPIWPELWGFYFNVFQGSASNWGTSPWYWYFTSALPKLVSPPLGLALVYAALWSPTYERIKRRLVIPNLLFVAIYSLQPHKEARFIFYVVPPLTAAAALGVASIIKEIPGRLGTDEGSRRAMRNVLSLVFSAGVLLTALGSAGILLVSSLNYPGGEALAALREMIAHDQSTVSTSVVTVHADVLSCMTGVTLFGVAQGSAFPTHHQLVKDPEVVVSGHGEEKPAVSLVLDKTEDEAVLSDPNFWTRFDYLLMEDQSAVKGGQWSTMAVVEGFVGPEILRPGYAHVEEEPRGVRRVGTAAHLDSLRDWVLELTSGWWVGPKTAPRIRIMKRIKEVSDRVAKEAMS
ncbi:hypothetical protein VSDG_07745 [Cytospora chrysosperma]|uniref:Mannosyltransferase n=1 Tax=Cytospora chrysosperma TaxID=252740 RepID=A0A423VK19_CYTCH|nr:hypothetical protein VSDG_07745 [Valsa sordida]